MTTQPARGSSTQPSPGDDPPMVLRAALAPSPQPQPFQIRLESRLSLEGPAEAQPGEVFTFEIAGTLTRVDAPDERDLLLTMQLKRLGVQLRRRDDEGNTESFEYPGETSATSQRLSQVLSALSQASLRLVVTPVGQLRQLRGVTALSREARLTMPPALKSLRLLLSDVAFERIVTATLFPPLPSAPIRVGDSWQMSAPASAFDTCSTTTRLTGRVRQVTRDAQHLPVVTVDSEGTVILSEHCGRQERLAESRVTVRQTLSWNDHSLSQHVRRRLVLELNTQPPATSAPAGRRVREETLSSSRFGAATSAISP